MTAIWMRARSELRTRFAAVLSLGIIVGVIGGVVIAAAAGARRTESAYPRFIRAQHALDVVIDVSGDDLTVVHRVIDQVRHLPEVESSGIVTAASGELLIPGEKAPGTVFPIVSVDGRFGRTINAAKIVDGRMYDPRASDEIVPSFAVANQLGLHVGDTVQFAFSEFFIDGPVSPGFTAPAPVEMHVVGIGAIPSMFQPLAGGYLPGVLLTPAFFRSGRGFIQGYNGIGRYDLSPALVLRHGAADLTSLRDAVGRLKAQAPSGVTISIPFVAQQQTAGVEQTTSAQATALWVLALLVLAAGLAVFSQSLARQTFLESIEYPTLRSMGMSPAQLVAVGMIRAAVIGCIGAAVAVVVGYLLSPFTPTGVARLAEPHPGFAFDGVVVALGAIATAVLVTLIGALPALRAAVAKGSPLGAARPRRSRARSVAGLLRQLPPSGTAGVRMALEPGAGRTAVPVRTAILGATISLVAMTAALAFGSSLEHLQTTPRLSGWNWDTVMFTGNDDPNRAAVEAAQLRSFVEHSPAVAEYSTGTIVTARVGTVTVLSVALEPHRGDVTPSLIEGRLPVGADEIALGTETMHRAHVGIGDLVPVHTGTGDFRLRVVGRVAVPNLFFSFTRPGQGAALSTAGALRIAPDQIGGTGGIFLRLAPGADPAKLARSIKRVVPDLFVVPRQDNAQLKSLNEVGRVPLVLAGILALMAAATLAHTLLTSIRRRRLDLAILKTLGFVRGQVSATLAWQATTFGAAALVIGLPIGVIAGRWGWNVFADHLGVVPDAVVPLLIVFLAVPATILVANLLAVLPGRIASRLRPGNVLRTE